MLMRGGVTTYDLERAEGEVLETGDAFNADTMNDLETRIGDAFDDVDNSISSAISALAGDIGDEYSDNKSYSAGAYCIKDNVLYKFTADKEEGDWDESVVEATTVGEELSELNDKLTVPVIVDTVTVDVEVGANAGVSASFSSTEHEGYTYLFSVVTETGSDYVFIRTLERTYIRLRSLYSSAFTCSVIIRQVFIKSDLL